MTTFRLLLLMTCSFFSLGFTLGTLMTNRRRDRAQLGVPRLTRRDDKQTRLDITPAIARTGNQRRVIPLFTPRGVK